MQKLLFIIADQNPHLRAVLISARGNSIVTQLPAFWFLIEILPRISSTTLLQKLSPRPVPLLADFVPENQRGAAAAFRTIPSKVLSLEELNTPKVFAELTTRPRGLILCTGPTGSGKSTTLAAMVDKINIERHDHILTIEDPIEYIHSHKNCLVNQREVHSDTQSFAAALRSALREDPDIVLVGEMRDLETVESALKIAETGHLAFATLHTNGAVQTVNRVIDVFPAHQQGTGDTKRDLRLFVASKCFDDLADIHHAR